MPLHLANILSRSSDFFLIPLLTIVVIAVALFKYIKAKKVALPANGEPSAPSSASFPNHEKQNDKLVIVKEAGYTEISKAITDFCKMYNKEKYQALPRLAKLNERSFAITFPYDISFEMFCYFVNYMVYPMELEKQLQVVGWVTAKDGDEFVKKDAINKKLMLFVPDNDKEGDNVFATAEDNTGYKLGFAVGGQKKLKGLPVKTFVPSPITVTSLEGNEHFDFK